MKERTLDGFGQRLKDIRQSRALTQAELGELVGESQRVVAYYEADDAQPCGALLVDLAQALQESADELLGIEPLQEVLSAKQARLRKRPQQVEDLPPNDQRAVLKFADALVVSRELEPEGSQEEARPLH